MRIGDVLRPYQDGIRRIVDATPPGNELRRYVDIQSDVEYVRSRPVPADRVPLGTMLVTIVGPDGARHVDPVELSVVLERLEPGARAMLLFAWQTGEVPYHRILDSLTRCHAQVLQVAGVDLAAIGAAAILERVEELQPPRDPLGEPIVPTPSEPSDRLELQLRVMNELMFSNFIERLVRKADPDSGSRPGLGDLADDRVRMLEKRISTIESSSSYRLSRALVESTKSLGALMRLPIDVIRIWRDRKR